MFEPVGASIPRDASWVQSFAVVRLIAIYTKTKIVSILMALKPVDAFIARSFHS